MISLFFPSSVWVPIFIFQETAKYFRVLNKIIFILRYINNVYLSQISFKGKKRMGQSAM